jgi:omega-6 fatty acid desaturase (delta-12 desaturase)
MHDCAHGSFVRSRRANDAIGFVTGAITLTPFAQWRRDHALHHASSGDLDRRGHGDVVTLTVDEYLDRTRWGRLKYRLYRHPFILFVLGPLYLIASQQWRAIRVRRRGAGWLDTFGSAALSATAIILLSVALGPTAVLLIYVPALLLAGAAGIWLFYVQHQFEDTYWQPHDGWKYADAALRGASYYRLPRVLEWMTGSIGLHHVHHIDPRIPNYKLRQCHEENSEFHDVTVLTLRESLRTASLKLWDADRGRLVGFAALKADERAAARKRDRGTPRAASASR